MQSIARLLDANANRAREALRVMEDAARFLLNDRATAAALKQIRHQHAAALSRIDRKLPAGLSAARNIEGDVGTSISTRTEFERSSARSVVIAAEKRAGEALRCLEEYAKLVDANAAMAWEQSRYRAYALGAKLLGQLPVGAQQWSVCVVLTQTLCTHHDWIDVARASLEGGADCLQLREKSLGDRRLLDRARKLVALRNELRSPAKIVINDAPDVTLLADADGVHLGQHDMSIADARRIVGPERIIGISTHNLVEARRAAKQRADYCGVGAIFATSTKQRRPAGKPYIQKFISVVPDMPHLCIGGIGPENIMEVLEAGGRGVAVSSAVCSAENPAAVVRKLRNACRKIATGGT